MVLLINKEVFDPVRKFKLQAKDLDDYRERTINTSRVNSSPGFGIRTSQFYSPTQARLWVSLEKTVSVESPTEEKQDVDGIRLSLLEKDVQFYCRNRLPLLAIPSLRKALTLCSEKQKVRVRAKGKRSSLVCLSNFYCR